MTNKQLQDYLKQFPDDIKIKILRDSNIPVRGYVKTEIPELTDENILHTSEGAWVDDDADPETWDTEDGKIVHEGDWYLLFNPIIT